MMAGKPDFEMAMWQFKELLGKCQYDQNILWVTPRDVIFPRRRAVYVKLPVPPSNEAEAGQTYQAGIDHGHFSGLIQRVVAGSLYEEKQYASLKRASGV